MKVGIISDTHGLLRPEVFEAFAGVEHILHGGDVGSPDLLVELKAIAPVTAVWGNTDEMDVRARVPEVARITLAGVDVVVTHGHRNPPANAATLARAHGDAGLVVFGHSHRPEVGWFDGTWAVNPGSAGKRRFAGPVSLAMATLAEGRVVEVTLIPW